MKPVRICMITHDQIDSKRSNADLIRFRSLGEALANHSMEVVFLTFNDKGRYEVGNYKGLKVHKIPLLSDQRIFQRICFSCFLLPVLLRATMDGPFDVLFLNSIVSAPAVMFYRCFSRKGLIEFDVMGLLSEEWFPLKPRKIWLRMAKKALAALENFFLSRVDFVSTINDHYKKLLQSRTLRPVFVIRDGVNQALLNQEWSSHEGKKRVRKLEMIFVGQIKDFRLDPLLKAFPALLKECPDLRLRVIGSGPQLVKYRERVDSSGLRDHVIFEGPIPHEKIFEYIADADIAYSDVRVTHGFPMKIFEYMAMGKPMVVEGGESVKELLTDRIHALLYESEAELTEKILTLVRDGELRKRIGENARQVSNAHTWEKRGEALTSIYEQYLGGKR